MADTVSDLTLTTVPVPQDEPPESTHAYSCEVCGKELSYGGRGRPPTKCEEHRKNNSSNARATNDRSTRVKGTNEQLAAQAAEILVTGNIFAGLGVLMLGLPLTAEALKEQEDTFRENAYRALLIDPKLCRRILQAGGTSATAALVMAYGTLAIGIAPIALTEFKVKREKAQQAAELVNSDAPYAT